MAGLYRGFWVSTPQIVSSLVYISSYEAIRHILATKFDMDSRIRALIAGGTSSIISQSIIVPFDVLSQHLMMLEMWKNTPSFLKIQKLTCFYS